MVDGFALSRACAGMSSSARVTYGDVRNAGLLTCRRIDEDPHVEIRQKAYASYGNGMTSPLWGGRGQASA